MCDQLIVAPKQCNRRAVSMVALTDLSIYIFIAIRRFCAYEGKYLAVMRLKPASNER